MKWKLAAVFFIVSHVAFSQTPPIWQNYLDNYNTEISPELLDFSFAGYRFSREELPEVSTWTYYDVTEYGAIPNDDSYDDAAIQSAIDAAEASEQAGVVYFPAGRYIVSSDNDVSKRITISKSNIVLKGSGSAEGETEIFMDQMRVANGHWQFEFKPQSTSSTQITEITGAVARGAFSVNVADASGLSVGQSIYISHESEEFARAHFGELELSTAWDRLFGASGGMSVFEPHLIKTIEGKKVTFENPVQVELPLLSSRFNLRELRVIEEVGIEDILFTSDWENYPEDFVHHKDDIHDYGWSAVQFLQVKNAWVKNCEFRSWNENIDVRQSIGVTIQDVLISGKKGHASFLTRRGYGLLVKDCIDEANQHHGPGTGYAGVNTVYVRCTMSEDQSLDSHSGQPYATLIDVVEGGVFDRNGGPHESYPHHARDLVFWNFRHNSSSNQSYNFWSVNSRNGNTYADPYFVGFQSNTEVSFQNEGLNQMPGTMVEPRSLFDAQLALRLTAEQSLPQLSFTTPGSGENIDKGTSLTPEVLASDPDGIIAYVNLYFNGELVGKDEFAPYQWSGSENELLSNLVAGVYTLKAEAVDNDSNRVNNEIEILAGRKPAVEIVRPENTKIIEEEENAEVEVTVSDTDGSIARVDLYLNDILVGTKTEAPFLWGIDENAEPDLFNLVAGDYSLKAVAYDNDGLTNIDIQNFVVNKPPNLSFSTPLSSDTFEEGANIKVNVGASDADGSISTVKLYLNGEFLGQDTNIPYTWGFDENKDPELFNMEPGEYLFLAEATDNRGSKRTDSIRIMIREIMPLAVYGAQNKEVKIYPNPFKESITLEAAEAPQRTLLYNMLGELIAVPEVNKSGEKYTLQLGNTIKEGIYFLYLLYPDEEIVLKVMK